MPKSKKFEQGTLEDSKFMTDQSNANSLSEPSACEQSFTKQPFVGESACETSFAKQSFAKKSFAKKSAVEQSCGGESAAEQSVAEQSTCKESAAETSFAEQSMPEPSKPKKETPHYHGHRTRLRERVLAGIHDVDSYELLELLLGYVHHRSDTKPMAKGLLKQFGSLWGILNAHPAELDSVDSVGPSSKVFFVLLRELVARYFVEPIKAKKSVTLDDVAMLARCMMDGLAHEEVWVALLDNNNRLLSFECVNTGFVESVVCSPRMVAEIAIAKKAKGVVLVHNHPGGVTKASWADAEMTNHIQTVMQYMGIRLLDHFILADGKIISLANNHLLTQDNEANAFFRND